jgi:hypothetical protein
MLFAEVGGAKHLVLSARKSKAQIEVDGKLTAVRTKTAYAIERGTAYFPGDVTFAEPQKTVTMVRPTDVSTGVRIGGGLRFRDELEYSVELTTSQSYDDCYIALVFVYTGFLRHGSNDASSVILFKEIGHIAANTKQAVSVDLSSAGLFEFYSMTGIPVLLVKGQEVHSNFSDWLGYYERCRDLAKHDRVIANYLRLNPSSDLAPQPYYQCAPVFPPGCSIPVEKVEAKLKIGNDGVVEAVELSPSLIGPARDDLQRSIAGWLFLPRLDKGERKPSEVRVMVSLKGSDQSHIGGL